MRGSIASLAFIVAALLGACSLNPPQLRGTFTDLAPAQASTNQFAGTDVRWGGIVTGARTTDAGACLEIGWYPLDRWTWQPQGLIYSRSDGIEQRLFNKTPHTVAYPRGNSAPVATPRFLACGEAAANIDRYFPGSVVTLTGRLAVPEIYAVQYTDCVREDRPWMADYSSTIHAHDDDTCVVSLPVVNMKSIVAWKPPPSSRLPSVWGW
jgi:hypothetical protein